jgi:hypothetical protein
VSHRPTILPTATRLRRALALIAVCVASGLLAPSDGVADAIVIMSDTNLSRCEVVDAGPGTFEAYVFHAFGEENLGSGFKIGGSEGFSGVFQSVQYPSEIFPLGDITAEGVSLGYGGCYSDPHKLIATLTYATFGTSETCSSIMVLPREESGLVEVYRCAYLVEPALAGSMVVNPGNGCWDACQNGVPTRETTWGAVKALYR